ncbi:MAG: hypothetical protein HZB82_00395 [Deltaproteobacteria bacterium]|nr:hypothetical protein [Deltaproteobacteria bacterium]
MSFFGNMVGMSAPKEAFSECSECNKKGLLMHLSKVANVGPEILRLYQCPKCTAVVCEQHVATGFTCPKCFSRLRRS